MSNHGERTYVSVDASERIESRAQSTVTTSVFELSSSKTMPGTRILGLFALIAAASAGAPSFLLAPVAPNCTCAEGSLGYECRNPTNDACYEKTGSVCPGGTAPLPDCCAHCAGGQTARGVCQDSVNLACFPAAADGSCPMGTLKCPPAPSGPTPAPKTPCSLNQTLCESAGGEAYCGLSADPDAVFEDGSGCSCGWGYHFTNKSGSSKCELGSCDGKCHDDPTHPCLGLNAPTCFPLVAGACPPGSKDCRYGAENGTATAAA